jgi:hypothetical protein
MAQDKRMNEEGARSGGRRNDEGGRPGRREQAA